MSGREHAGVLGRPIAHSRSPVLHRAAYAALGLDWQYSAIECGTAELADVLAQRSDWAGFSCTMPVKRALLEVADEVSPLVRTVGAGNTLLPRDGGWAVENTDVGGIASALAERAVVPATVTLLGAGGTAQAAVAALAPVTDRCSVLVRDVTRTRELRASADALGVRLDVACLDPDAAELRADLIVSTLPAGAADPLAARSWRPDQVLLDVVYVPWPTGLAAAVQAAGGTVLSGALVLLHQAAGQVELMTGKPAPVEAMRTALRAVVPCAGL